MKTRKIINKNIKLLLRSRISTLILILGPLLIIVLVGLSFSTSSFNLNMAVYSDDYSELTESFITNLNNESFSVIKYETNESCISSVKEQKTHACILFPPGLDIENEKTNIIKFYVDQSKVNLVYLVMSTLEKSFGEVTTKISKDLTNNIVTTLLKTKNDLDSADTLLKTIIADNTIITDNSVSSLNSLNELDFDSGAKSVSISLDSITDEIDKLKEETIELVEEGLAFAVDLDNHGSLTNNQSNDLEDIEDSFSDIRSTIRSRHNSTTKELNNLIFNLDSSLNELADKLDKAGTASNDAIKKLSELKDKSNNLKKNSKDLENKIKTMISSINLIKITNTENIVSPISTEINYIAQKKSNLGFLFPSLIVMLIMFIGLFLPSILIIMEKNSKAHFRVFTTPTKDIMHVLATYLTSIILVSLQLIIILTVSQFYFNINFFDSFFIIFISLFIIMTLFILLGMLIGYIINTEEMAMLASVSVATLFLLTSGIIFPIESMPQYIIEKVKFNPAVLGSDVLKKALLFDGGFSSVKQQLCYLFLSVLIIIGLIYLVKKLSKIQFKKKDRSYMEKKIILGYFDFGERKAKTLPEFIVSIQNLNEDKYLELLNKKAFRNWIWKVYNNRNLAKKIQDIKLRDELVDILTKELKK